MSQIMDSLIPAVSCFGVVSILLLIVGLIVGLRYISYREALALAEKGLARPESNRDGKASLRWGIIIAALGLALSLGLYPLGLSFGSRYPLGFGPWMLFGLIPLFFGLALILIYLLTREKQVETDNHQ